MKKEVAVPTQDKIVISARRQSEPTREIAAPDTQDDRQGSLVGTITEVFKAPSLDGLSAKQVASLFTMEPKKASAKQYSVEDECTWSGCDPGKKARS